MSSVIGGCGYHGRRVGMRVDLDRSNRLSTETYTTARDKWAQPTDVIHFLSSHLMICKKEMTKATVWYWHP